MLGGAARKQVACPGNMAGRRRPQQPKRAVACNGLWSVEVVLQQLRKKRLDPKTVERVYEVGGLRSDPATPLKNNSLAQGTRKYPAAANRACSISTILLPNP